MCVKPVGASSRKFHDDLKVRLSQSRNWLCGQPDNYSFNRNSIKHKTVKIQNTFVIIFLLAAFGGCTEDFSDNPKPNQPPSTFLSIFSDKDLSATISRQTLNWWGDDPDGIVKGFIFTFNPNAENVEEWNENSSSLSWTFTTATQETFTLSLAGRDTVFSFWVKAIDDEGAADPNGAVQDFPVINTRPVVDFPVGTDVPESTFTVAEFVWTGTDLDGDDTISKYQYVLDDTTDESAWIDVDGTTTSVVLTELVGGEHVFFLRAVDLAGAKSALIRMPREQDNVWFVREPSSNFLMVDDHNTADNTDSFYKSTVQEIVGPVDVWDIKSNGSALEPPTVRAFLLTLKLFDRIFWYADTGPTLDKAQAALPTFIEEGGKVLMSTSFREFSSNQGDPLDFSPADSLGIRISRITRNQLIVPTTDYAALGLPDLQVNTAIIPNVFPVVPKISSQTMYTLPSSSAWPGTPPMAVINADQNFVFWGLPLAVLNGQETVPTLFRILLVDVLGE